MGGELVGTKIYLCAHVKKRIFVYKLDSFVGFIGDEQLQECNETAHDPAPFSKYPKTLHQSHFHRHTKSPQNHPLSIQSWKYHKSNQDMILGAGAGPINLPSHEPYPLHPQSSKA
jgi:hypothetical protein